MAHEYRASTVAHRQLSVRRDETEPAPITKRIRQRRQAHATVKAHRSQAHARRRYALASVKRQSPTN